MWMVINKLCGVFILCVWIILSFFCSFVIVLDYFGWLLFTTVHAHLFIRRLFRQGYIVFQSKFIATYGSSYVDFIFSPLFIHWNTFPYQFHLVQGYLKCVNVHSSNKFIDYELIYDNERDIQNVYICITWYEALYPQNVCHRIDVSGLKIHQKAHYADWRWERGWSSEFTTLSDQIDQKWFLLQIEEFRSEHMESSNTYSIGGFSNHLIGISFTMTHVIEWICSYWSWKTTDYWRISFNFQIIQPIYWNRVDAVHVKSIHFHINCYTGMPLCIRRNGIFHCIYLILTLFSKKNTQI